MKRQDSLSWIFTRQPELDFFAIFSNFHDYASDDVIEDVLARGVIGDEADGCRVRGAVGV